MVVTPGFTYLECFCPYATWHVISRVHTLLCLDKYTYALRHTLFIMFWYILTFLPSLPSVLIVDTSDLHHSTSSSSQEQIRQVGCHYLHQVGCHQGQHSASYCQHLWHMLSVSFDSLGGELGGGYCRNIALLFFGSSWDPSAATNFPSPLLSLSLVRI